MVGIGPLNQLPIVITILTYVYEQCNIDIMNAQKWKTDESNVNWKLLDLGDNFVFGVIMVVEEAIEVVVVAVVVVVVTFSGWQKSPETSFIVVNANLFTFTCAVVPQVFDVYGRFFK